MAENAGSTENTESQNQQIQIIVDESAMKIDYSNLPRVHQTAEEVFIDFGVQSARPNQTGEPQIVFRINERIIMSYPTIKRLATALSKLVSKYEMQFGEIQTIPGPKGYKDPAK